MQGFTMPHIPSMCEGFQESLLKAIRDFEANLKPGEELAVFCEFGNEVIQVSKFGCVGGMAAVAVGIDANGARTRILSSVMSFKFMFKALKHEPGSRSIGFTVEGNQGETAGNG
ncbi:MAG TPA: hypothetical protein VII95_17140 [Terriglobales bacterium]|jgi:hypothetical protein